MTAVLGKHIDRIRVRLANEDAPDLSHLGEYSDTPEPGCIDRKARGDAGRGEFRYFNPGTGDREYIEADYKRAEAFNAGDWGMVGVYAEAEIVVNGATQRIRSAGLWNVESDSGCDYFRTIGREEVAQLCRTLAELGFTPRQVRRAVADMRERGDDDGSD